MLRAKRPGARAKPAGRWVRRSRALGCLSLVGLLTAVAAALFFWEPVTSGKYEPLDEPARPRARPGAVVAETQDEPHTCGLHALSSVYRAYGLDPVARRLRFRLGVDRPGLPFDDETRGSLHPDVFRVAMQDGLAVRAVEPGDDAALRAHLARGQLAVLLIHTRAGDALHWVVADRVQGDALRVHDSLVREPYLEPLPEWLGTHVESVLLIAPTAPPSGVHAAHARGLAEMRRVAGRLAAR